MVKIAGVGGLVGWVTQGVCVGHGEVCDSGGWVGEVVEAGERGEVRRAE